jgi:hypothetical protein
LFVPQGLKATRMTFLCGGDKSPAYPTLARDIQTLSDG